MANPLFGGRIRFDSKWTMWWAENRDRSNRKPVFLIDRSFRSCWSALCLQLDF